MTHAASNRFSTLMGYVAYSGVSLAVAAVAFVSVNSVLA